MEPETFPCAPSHKTPPHLFQHKDAQTQGEEIPTKCPHNFHLHFPGCLQLLSVACLGSDVALLHAEAGPGDVHLGKGLRRTKPHCPGTYLLFASWLQGMQEGARYRVKWQGSQCPRLFQDAPGLMVKQPRRLPCSPNPRALPALTQQSWEQGPAAWDTQLGKRSWWPSFQLLPRAAHSREDQLFWHGLEQKWAAPS